MLIDTVNLMDDSVYAFVRLLTNANKINLWHIFPHKTVKITDAVIIIYFKKFMYVIDEV